MKKTFKRVLLKSIASLLFVMILLGSFPFSAVAFYYGYEEIGADDYKYIYIEPDESCMFYFCAPSAGEYTAYTDCLDSGDPYLSLWSARMGFLDSNDDYFDDGNSSITF